MRLPSVEDIPRIDELLGQFLDDGANSKSEWKDRFLSLLKNTKLDLVNIRIANVCNDCTITVLIQCQPLNPSYVHSHDDLETLLKDLCQLLLGLPLLQSVTLIQAILGDSTTSLSPTSLNIDETVPSTPLGVTCSFNSKCFTQHFPSNLDILVKSHHWCMVYKGNHDWRQTLLTDIWNVLRVLPCSPEFIEKILHLFRCGELHFRVEKSFEMNLLVTFLCPELGVYIHDMTSELSPEESRIVIEQLSKFMNDGAGDISLEFWLSHALYDMAIISYLSHLLRHK